MSKPIHFGKYYLLERINVGGMAEVFRAKHFGVEGFERLVAVKRILPSIAEDKEFIAMFIDEAKIAVMLNHANIAQVFDLGQENGAYYIALEHIHGRDLRAIFDRNRDQGNPMPVPQACFISMKVCEGLDYAHNKRDETGRDLKLVHRDVSPQNVLVSFDGEVKIIDFGIAKAAGKGSQTQAGILKGKFGYMSPEQVRGLPVDRRSDVFACGIVLYELLTGERLFVGESDFSTLEKVRNVEILPPSTYNRKIQPELERIVLKALAKDVEDRYQNAIDLHDELQAFVYTSGEFYSRKDLASWMKQMWAKEIQEETIKIASYRDMAPPPQSPSPQPQTMAEASEAGRSRSQTVSARGRKTIPPPIPGVSNGASAGPPKLVPKKDRPKGNDLEWDDDELETSIYDDDELPAATIPDNAVPLAAAGAGPSAPALTGSALGGDTLVEPKEEPDLSSLVSTAHGWDAPKKPAKEPDRIADGSNKTKSPLGAKEDGESSAKKPVPSPTELAAASASSAVAEPFFGGPTLSAQPPQRNNLPIYLVALAMLFVGVVGVVYMLTRKDAPVTVAAGTPTQAVVGDSSGTPAISVTRIADENTGFDLIVDPPGSVVKLDGKVIGNAPLKIRKVVGEQKLEIEGPIGFISQSKTIIVEMGSAEQVRITLAAKEVIGVFSSQPLGAKVVLIANGLREEIGTTPMRHKLNPRKKYDVLYSLDGYTSLTKPLAFNGEAEIELLGVLEKGKVVVRNPDKRIKVPKVVNVIETPITKKPDLIVKTPVNPKVIVKTPPTRPVNAGSGTLLLNAKPPCKIFVDGR
ncbi:MAG: serine/threonine protein kinase, partial [Kofleriaceae bacterium]|nr:serine/threonine protein kinase [Kofleriaceae bacterium]